MERFDSQRNKTKLILTIFQFIVFSTTGFGKIIKAGKQEIITTISKALTIAAPGDTIILQSGNYREGSLRVTRPVVIIGINNPVLDGENKYQILTISSD